MPGEIVTHHFGMCVSRGLAGGWELPVRVIRIPATGRPLRSRYLRLTPAGAWPVRRRGVLGGTAPLLAAAAVGEQSPD